MIDFAEAILGDDEGRLGRARAAIAAAMGPLRWSMRPPSPASLTPFVILFPSRISLKVWMSSNRIPLHLVEADLVASAIV